MASPPNGSDQDRRPAACTRSRTGLENMLPTSFGKRDRSKSRTRPGPAPHMSRSISSAMTDSFVLDHRGSYRPSLHDNDKHAASASDPRKTEEEEGLMPISNWAHLNFLKNQRNTLRNELKVQALAGAEAKRSVSSLRRLAFRMAVNISVKERQIATSAKNLSQSRTGNDLQSKEAETRIESLKRALRVEEKRNVEVLEALEHSTPKPKSQHRLQRSLLSPPPSPPTQLSDYSESSLGSPRTPTRPTTFDRSLTPGLESPTEIRTSDSRLIQAKRDCDRALAACRSRITELQEECAQSREINESILASRDELEHEIKDHQSRIATLERSRAAMEATLVATKQQLLSVKETEDRLTQDLNNKAQEIRNLEHSDKDKQQTIDILREEKLALEKMLQIRASEFQELEHRTSSLDADTRLLQSKLESAERQEASLQDRFNEKERAREDLQKRLDRGTRYIQLLEHKVRHLESDAVENSKLKTQLQESKEATDNAKAALATLASEVVTLRRNLETETNAHKQLSTEVETNRATISQLKDEHAIAQSTLEQERALQSALRTELESTRSLYELACNNLQAAETRVQSLENLDHDNREKLEALRDGKTSLEADLREARESLLILQQDKKDGEAELSRMEKSRAELRDRLQTLEGQVVSLQQELEDAHIAETAMKEAHAMDLQKNRTQLTEFETSLRVLKGMLASADQAKLDLQEEVHHIQSSKESTELQLIDALQSRESYRLRCDSIEDQLKSIESERTMLVTRVSQLENDLANSSVAKNALEERLDDASARRKELESLVSELQSSLEAAHDVSSTLEAAYSSAQRDSESSRAQVANLHEQLDEIKLSREEAEARYQASNNSNKLLEDQLLVAKSKLAEVESDSNSILTELSAVRNELSQYEKQNAVLTTSLEALQMQSKDQQEELAVAKSRWEAAEQRAETLQLKLSMAEEEIDMTRREKLKTEGYLEEAIESNKDLDNSLRTARQERANAEERLTAALGLSLQATSELASTQSKLFNADSERAHLVSTLNEKEVELEALLQSRAKIQSQLNESVARVTTLEEDLLSTRTQLLDIESENSSHVAELSANEEMFARLRKQETDLKKQLAQAVAHSASLEEDAAHAHKRVLELEQRTAEYLAQLSSSSADTEILRAAYAQSENHLKTVTVDKDDLEKKLRATAMRLDIAEVEGLRSATELLEADHVLKILRESNAKLEQSEQHLSARLASAENDLHTVRETNSRLESILERVTKDMDQAEATVKESSRQFEEYLTESQTKLAESHAKLDAARSAKLKLRDRLSEKAIEMEAVTAENRSLHKQVDEQTVELGDLKKGKAKLEEALSLKESYMNELRSSSDKRIRSLNAAYNGLKKEHEERAHQTRPTVARNSTSRLEAELRSKDAEIEKMQTSKDSYAALKREVESLREDKKAFQRLVEQLQEKVEQLQVLEEWVDPIHIGSPNSSRHITILDDTFYSLPSSPSTGHTKSPRPESIFSMGHQGDRPPTRASQHSHDEDLDGWAQEVEHVRMLRNETAIQLRDLRRSKHDLKKDLKHTEAELHRLEKEHKDKRYRNLLKKGHRPTTPFRSPALPSEPFDDHTSHVPPTTPIRPRTSSGIPITAKSDFRPGHKSRHSTMDMPQDMFASSPDSEHRRWPTTLRNPHATSQRPGTGHSLRQRLSHRQTTSVKEEEHGGKRRWSSGKGS
ncbi:hypothetical protein LEMA_P090890.1 [Plenodomus lingam JN3]|uniref:Uncharacterized protein n=1 Tax=Leptosphaeria maculans (strain JN3 / isolate v23.1.3 / race Av1-4-5-6-7-8) TaxID=985895 RepID=E5A1W3_LEPMJ|nr:hypothetical protein LEMA_P090890.1 [Plenodomus lingam JN3]CBX97680.1 hypothetical protein LEMA_P090890.1 [Plenodomus lingam JN3]